MRRKAATLAGSRKRKMDWMFDESYGPAFEVAQICLAGHVINDCSRTESMLNQQHCATCGEPTTTKCKQCGSEIRGRLMGPGIIHSQLVAPSYCWKCGHPYPWTERRLQAAKQLVDTFDDELDESDRATLKESIDVLAKDSPELPVAGARTKKILRKLAKEPAKKLYDVFVDVASETAKKLLEGYMS